MVRGEMERGKGEGKEKRARKAACRVPMGSARARERLHSNFSRPLQVTSNFGHALSSLTKFFRIAKADPDLNGGEYVALVDVRPLSCVSLRMRLLQWPSHRNLAFTLFYVQRKGAVA